MPGLIEHSDYYLPEICYLTAGDVEKSLNSIETQLAHEPRYQAALREREQRIARQAQAVETLKATVGAE